MSECGHQSRVPGPLKVRLTQRLVRPCYSFFVLPQEQMGVGHAHEKGTHVRIPRAQADGVLEMRESLPCSPGENQSGTDAIVRPCVARVDLQRRLELRDGQLVFTPEVVDSSQGAVGSGVIAVEFHCPLRGGECLLAVVVG